MAKHRFQLSRAMSADRQVDIDDILQTKQALNRLGYYRSEHGLDGGWVDGEMFSGIRRLQRDNGLREDGEIKPESETAKIINRLLRSAPANDDQEAPANDNGEQHAAGSKCERQYNADARLCRILLNPVSKAACWASASERRDSCKRGMYVPPLRADRQDPTTDEA
jgi:hypothetical protein